MSVPDQPQQTGNRRPTCFDEHRDQANAAGACVFVESDGGEPSRLGVLEADLCGFPNGRRLIDDVVDIELRAVADATGRWSQLLREPDPQPAPNNTVGDGVDENDVPFLASSRSLRPNQGYEHVHHGMGGL